MRGTVTYKYDNAGNLTDRPDARNVTTHYSYDALNRITLQSYSDATPTVNYTYDNPNDYGMGLLSQVSNGISTTTISFYDPQSRVTSSQQTTGGQTYNFSYTYNLAGALTAETLPSGRVLTTSYNTLNQPASVSGTLNGTTKSYVTAATYAAHGAPAQVWLGNTLVDNYTYNNRLQPASVSTSVNNNTSNTFLGYSLNWGSTNSLVHANELLQAYTNR